MAIAQDEAMRKARTDKVVSDMVELEDDDLEGVAGGWILSCDEILFCGWEFAMQDCNEAF